MLCSTIHIPYKPCIPLICPHTLYTTTHHNLHATPTTNACKIMHVPHRLHNIHIPHTLTTYAHSIDIPYIHSPPTPYIIPAHILSCAHSTYTQHTQVHYDRSVPAPAPACASDPTTDQSQPLPVLADAPLGASYQ